MRRPISIHAFSERLGVSSFQCGGGAAGLAGGDRVLTPEQQRPAGARLLTCLGERDGMDGA
jgi:hypothetical protein